MSSYCQIARAHPLHGPYHDTEYGVPAQDERVLFERLVLEIMQAGLSWELVLRRRAGLRVAFGGFDVDAVAAYAEDDLARLLGDPAVIRNRRKLAAVVGNAQAVVALRPLGGFAAWLDAHHPRAPDAWVKLFRTRFAFVGGEIVGSFLISLGYLPGAHDPDCPAGLRIRDAPWQRA